MPGESTLDPPAPVETKCQTCAIPGHEVRARMEQAESQEGRARQRAWSGTLKVAARRRGLRRCMAALVILILLLFPPGSVAVVLVGADYADNLLVPHNILGWEGLVGLETLCKTSPRWTLLGARPPTLIRPLQQIDQVDKWDTLIADLKKKPFKQQTIIIVVGMHGGSSSKNAYLIPDKMADPDDQLDLKHVIKSMGQLPAEKQKVLVLEGANLSRLAARHAAQRFRPPAAGSRGRDPPCPGCGCRHADVDQRCWVSEGLGRTVFSHYLIEALRGKADWS